MQSSAILPDGAFFSSQKYKLKVKANAFAVNSKTNQSSRSITIDKVILFCVPLPGTTPECYIPWLSCSEKASRDLGGVSTIDPFAHALLFAEHFQPG